MGVHKVETLFANSLEDSALSDKQKAVLRASLTLFSEQGFDRTSTADIAKRAQVSEGTVYKHFKTKAEIRSAILSSMGNLVVPAAASEFVAEIDPQALTSLEALLQFVVADRLQFASDNRAVIRVFVQEALMQPALVQNTAQQLTKQFEQGFAPRLHQLIQAKQLVDWPMLRLFRTVAGTVLSYALPVVMLPPANTAFDVEQATAEIVETLLKVLRP
ncbi:TetR/AcrR family transcriptional regulator [Lacticaseibacillus baoqingensis]|uniref:TetR/AcrR family transcriptional regulator n=1 Tax=Lacticaseibacillus baoqingensis TaxID=2486013 RepID=A0ABW4E951_9LACO|nr:TetR/AcrR family transcriptional regulator [Lacticaseibacillus baoqingensis]